MGIINYMESSPAVSVELTSIHRYLPWVSSHFLNPAIRPNNPTQTPTAPLTKETQRKRRRTEDVLHTIQMERVM